MNDQNEKNNKLSITQISIKTAGGKDPLMALKPPCSCVCSKPGFGFSTFCCGILV